MARGLTLDSHHYLLENKLQLHEGGGGDKGYSVQ